MEEVYEDTENWKRVVDKFTVAAYFIFERKEKEKKIKKSLL
jgi:hypothetical protein